MFGEPLEQLDASAVRLRVCYWSVVYPSTGFCPSTVCCVCYAVGISKLQLGGHPLGPLSRIFNKSVEPPCKKNVFGSLP